MDYKQLLLSELDKEKDLYLSGEKRPMAGYVIDGKYVDFYLNDNLMFTLEAEGDAKHFGESILDELQVIAKTWRDENKTMMS